MPGRHVSSGQNREESGVSASSMRSSSPIGDVPNSNWSGVERITADEDMANLSAIGLLKLTPATVACGHGDPLSNHTVDDLMAFFNELRQSEH